MEDLIKNQFNNSTLINPVFKSGDHEIPKFIGIPVFLPDVFIGREHDLESVHQKLFEGDNLLLLVNGEGGIGKTALAAHYYNKYADRYNHLAWIFAEKSLADALLTLALPLGVCFPDQSSEDERLYLLLQSMRQLKKPCLLVIDNANDLAELEKYYKTLHSCPNFHLLLTTRITKFEQAATYPIEALPDANAMELFKKYYPEHLESEDELLRQLLVAIGKNTLIIELLAKNLHNFNQLETCYSLSNLLEDLNEKGLFGVSGKVVSTDWHAKGNALRKEKPEDIISILYDLSNLGVEERQLLSVFAVLPAENISFEELKNLLPETEQLDTNLLLLAQKGWLSNNKEIKSFKISPVVQETTQAKNNDLANDCQQLISNLIDKLDYEEGTGHFLNVTYPEAFVYSQYAESVIHCIRKADVNLAILSERVGSFHRTTGNLDKALTFYLDFAYLMEELYEAYPQNDSFKNWLAISYEKLGDTYTELGNLDKALTFYQCYTSLMKELYEVYPQDVDCKNGLAFSYAKLGDIYNKLENFDKALAFRHDFACFMKELYEDCPQNVSFKNGLAISYSKLGDTNTKLENLENALTFHQDETALFEELYEAWPQNVDFKNGLAISYERLGKTHTSLENLDKALTYFEQRSNLVKELYETFPQNVDFKNGLAISYQYLGNTHTSLGNLDKALTYFEQFSYLEKELYEAFPQNVAFKNGLAASYYKLAFFYKDDQNDPDSANTLFGKAEKLWSELAADFPQYVEFSRNLKQVRKDLGE